MITSLLIKPFSSRIRVIVGSGISMVATDLASAKLSAMLANAKIASMQATKLVATKIAAKLTALWMLMMSFFMPLQPLTPVTHQPVVRHHHVAAAPEIKIFSKKLILHSFEKDYTCVFTGKVSCGGAPCNASVVQVHITSKRNPYIVKAATIQPDGSFEVSILVKEYLHEHLDWWIVADSPESASKQAQGREILMEDSHISIDQSIDLL